ncbi:hypothetical protein ACYOEI_21180 [Singulisphaera rosea]
MMRMRLSTLMLLIVIAALSTTLIVKPWRAALVEARLRADMAKSIARQVAEERKIINAQKTNPRTTNRFVGAGEGP